MNIDNLKEEVKTQLSTKITGRNIAANLTDRIDKYILNCLPQGFDTSPFAIYAIGGYGRREMSLYSDVDVMFLAKSRVESTYMEDIYYKLIDSGLAISHSFRTIDECIDEAKKDINTRTSMIDSRFLAGNVELSQDFQKKVYPSLLLHPGGQKALFLDLIGQLKTRHDKYGKSTFLLEPDLKYSIGSLRDIHDTLWLLRFFLNAKDFENHTTLFGKDTFKAFYKAHDFLLSTRLALHLESGRVNELLSFDYQEQVADLLDIRDNKKFRASERLLRRYYIKARCVNNTSTFVRNFIGKRFVRHLKVKFTSVRVDNVFSIARNMIMVNNRVLIKRNPVQILNAYLLYSKTGKLFTDFLRNYIKKNLDLINKDVRSDPRANKIFLDILKGGNRVYSTLKMMHTDGVLDRFIPEFGRLRFLVVHEPYHIYTVDEHSLFAIKAVEELGGYSNKELDGIGRIYHTYKDKHLLYLALLFHDIGKARGRLHSTESYKSLPSILDRLKVDRAERNTILFLVRNHMLLYEVALKKDMEDPEVIAQFVDVVDDEKLLEALMVVTYGDMCAVNSKFWTSWKNNLFIVLMNRAKQYIRGVNESTYKRVEYLSDEMQNNNGEMSDFLDTMPKHYFLTNTVQKVEKDFVIFRKFKKDGFAFNIEEKVDGTHELTIIARDRTGLLTSILGVLAARMLNIILLRTFENNDKNGSIHFVIDRVVVSNYRDLWWDGMDGLLKEEIKGVVIDRKKVNLSNYRVQKECRFSSFINIDNDSSQWFSIVEIFSADRIGLLRDIAEVFAIEGYNIAAAKFNTESDVAMGAFYINKDGAKVESLQLSEGVKKLWGVLE